MGVNSLLLQEEVESFIESVTDSRVYLLVQTGWKPTRKPKLEMQHALESRSTVSQADQGEKDWSKS